MIFETVAIEKHGLKIGKQLEGFLGETFEIVILEYFQSFEGEAE
jgi:hypothetical protein